MRHRGAAFLAFAKIFFHFENFSPLKMAKLCRPAIDARRNHCDRCHELRVPIPLHDLCRKRRWFNPKLFADRAFNFWIYMCVRADGAADLADANSFAHLRETLFCAAEFVVHQREF